MDFPDLPGHLEAVRRRITDSAARCGRDPADVTLVAVTKAHPFSAMQEALRLGLLDLGENRVQEALPKLDRLGDTRARVHLVGQLQTNKVNKAVGRFASIMSVDRPELVAKLARRAAEMELVQACWVQVNTSGEEQKAGCGPAEASALVDFVRAEPSLDLLGLMTLGRLDADEGELRRGFSSLRELRDRVCPGLDLSMGMSGDFEVAIEEGATWIRLGTCLFGARPARG